MNNKGELMPGGTVARPGKSDKEHLVGSWILISLSAGDGAKETMPYGPNPKDTRWTQRPFFDHAAAVRSTAICIRQSHDRDAGGEHADRAGVHRLFGTYSIDEATHVITVNVEGSTFPNFDGGTQTRILSFSGDEGTYLNPAPSMGGGTAKVTYRRTR
jgi:Lipocalin-like domain